MNDDDDFIVNSLRKAFSVALSILAWISVFVLSWLVLARILAFDALSIGFWSFFLFVALVSGATGKTARKPSK